MDLLSINQGMFLWTLLVFLILVYVLGKFAWKPMLSMIDQREAKIKKSIQMSETVKIEAEMLLNRHKKMLEDGEQEVEQLIRKAKEFSDKQLAEAKKKAKEEAAQIISKAKVEIEAQKDDAVKVLMGEIASFIAIGAGKIIEEHLDEAKSKLLIDKYLNELLDKN